MTAARVRPALRFAAACALVALAGCARCGGGKSNRPAEELAPADTTLSVAAPNLGQLADRMQAMLATARKGAGGDRLVQLSAALAMQLGFDPLTRDGLKAAGLDAGRSAALGTFAAQRGAYAILPWDDRATLEATVDRLVRDRAGAAVKEERTEGNVKVTVLAEAAGGEPTVAYVAKDGFLILATGAGSVAWAASASQRKTEESLAKVPGYGQMLTKLGARDVYAYMPKVPGRGTTPELPGAVGLGLAVSGSELALRAAIDLAPEQVALAKTALVGGGDALLAMLPKDAPVYLRGALDLAAMLKGAESRPEVKELADNAREAAKTIQVDLDSELLGNLEPGFALALGIAPTANLSNAFDFDPRRTNPFESYTLMGVGRVKDAEKAKATMEKLAPVIEELGSKVVVKELAGAKAWSAEYRLGQGLTWTLRGKELVVAGGFGDALGTVLEGLGDKAKVVAPAQFAPRAKEALFRKDGLAFAIDFGRIGESVDKLPTEAFGTGPGALMARSVASGIVQPLSRLKAVLAVAPAEGGVVVDLAVSAQ